MCSDTSFSASYTNTFSTSMKTKHTQQRSANRGFSKDIKRPVNWLRSYQSKMERIRLQLEEKRKRKKENTPVLKIGNRVSDFLGIQKRKI